jgi:hypothetical protein
MKMLDAIPLSPGAFYVLDRGYLDFTRLIRLEETGAFFVVRNKRHVRFRVTESRICPKASGVRCDQTIQLTTKWSRSVYSKPLLFFKWIKQHLRIRNFYGRSENAVRCQVWTAICSYLLVAIARKELKLEQSLYQTLQIVSVSAFEQVTLADLFARSDPVVAIDPQANFKTCLTLNWTLLRMERVLTLGGARTSEPLRLCA